MMSLRQRRITRRRALMARHSHDRQPSDSAPCAEGITGYSYVEYKGGGGVWVGDSRAGDNILCLGLEHKGGGGQYSMPGSGV